MSKYPKVTSKNPRALNKLFYNLWFHLKKRRKVQFFILIFLMLFASLAEMISIGAVIPLLTALANPELIYEIKVLKPLLNFLKVSSAQDLLLPMTILFCLAAIFAGCMRLLLLWVQTRLSHSIGADLSISVFRKTLYQDYAVHISRNSSEIISAVATKTTNLVYQCLWPLINIISSTIVVLGILALLLSINFKLSFVAFSLLSLIYIFNVLVFKKRLNQYSQIIANKQNSVYKSLQEGLHGIRDVLIHGNQEIYVKHYKNADIPLRLSMAYAQIIGNSPRFIVEALGMVVIASIAYYFIGPEQDFQTIIPTLGSLALGAQRLLPLIQQIYSSWAAIISGHQGLEDVISLMDQELKVDTLVQSKDKINFNKFVKIENLRFSYPESQNTALKNINFSFEKGQCIGVIGSSGSGKSTFLDVIMGLLEPEHGQIIIDKIILKKDNIKSWQKHIAHVPQNIFLLDTTVAQNVAFGIAPDKINMKRVYDVAKKAQIHETIMSMENHYDTIIGEKGARLSGGQRQRIGIARALYKSASLLVLDEATSALDNQTEELFLKSMSFGKTNLTTIMVAHRLSSLRYCNSIIELEKGQVSRVGNYKEIIGN